MMTAALKFTFVASRQDRDFDERTSGTADLLHVVQGNEDHHPGRDLELCRRCHQDGRSREASELFLRRNAVRVSSAARVERAVRRRTERKRFCN